MRAAKRLPATRTPALEAGVFYRVEQIGFGTDSISIVTHGREQVLPFDPDPDTLVVEGPFDPEIVADPGGVITTLPLAAIVRITLDHEQLTLEDRRGVRLTWRLCFLGHRAAADVRHPRGEHRHAGLRAHPAPVPGPR